MNDLHFPAGDIQGGIIPPSIDDGTRYNPNNKLRKQIERLLVEEQEQKKRTHSYYKELTKDNKRLLLDPAIQKQMHADAMALGNAFADTDDL